MLSYSGKEIAPEKGTLLTLSGFLLVAFYTPVILIWLGVIPFQFRFLPAFLVIFLAVFYTLKRRLRWSDLGFRRDTLKASLKWNLGISFFFLSLLYIFYRAGWFELAEVRLWPFFLLFYVLVLTPAQEFFFRSILFAELKKMRVRAPLSIIALSSLSYGFLHVIYQKPVALLVTLFMGVIWSCIYYRHPNFWGVTLSHALLGTAALAAGIL